MGKRGRKKKYPEITTFALSEEQRERLEALKTALEKASPVDVSMSAVGRNVVDAGLEKLGY